MFKKLLTTLILFFALTITFSGVYAAGGEGTVCSTASNCDSGFCPEDVKRCAPVGFGDACGVEDDDEPCEGGLICDLKTNTCVRCDSHGSCKDDKNYICLEGLCAYEPSLADGGTGLSFPPTSARLNEDIVQTRTFGDLLTIIINYFVGFLGFLAVISFIASGVMMVANLGNEEMITKAKKMMGYSALGLLVVMISWSAVRFITSAGDGAKEGGVQMNINNLDGYDVGGDVNTTTGPCITKNDCEITDVCWQSGDRSYGMCISEMDSYKLQGVGRKVISELGECLTHNDCQDTWYSTLVVEEGTAAGYVDEFGEGAEPVPVCWFEPNDNGFLPSIGKCISEADAQENQNVPTKHLEGKCLVHADCFEVTNGDTTEPILLPVCVFEKGAAYGECQAVTGGSFCDPDNETTCPPNYTCDWVNYFIGDNTKGQCIYQRSCTYDDNDEGDGTNADCLPYQTCSKSGYCETPKCTVEKEMFLCPSDHYCKIVGDALTGQCKPKQGCGNRDDCPNGFFCDSGPMNNCSTAIDSTECTALGCSLKDVEGTETCTGNILDCEDLDASCGGDYCEEETVDDVTTCVSKDNGICELLTVCGSSNDCSPGQDCRNGMCQRIICENNKECCNEYDETGCTSMEQSNPAYPWICKSNRCLPNRLCVDNADCTYLGKYFCDAGQCRYEYKCAEDNECPVGSVCTNRVEFCRSCTGVAADDPEACDQCNSTDKICIVEPCRKDADCSFGSYCHKSGADPVGVCRQETKCAKNDNCFDGYFCEKLDHSEECSGSEDCSGTSCFEEGGICKNNNGLCGTKLNDECEADNKCKWEDSECLDRTGICNLEIRCFSNQNCPAGNYCDGAAGGICRKKGCTTSDECGEGSICMRPDENSTTGRCYPTSSCLTSAECPQGYQCKIGTGCDSLDETPCNQGESCRWNGTACESIGMCVFPDANIEETICSNDPNVMVDPDDSTKTLQTCPADFVCDSSLIGAPDDIKGKCRYDFSCRTNVDCPLLHYCDVPANETDGLCKYDWSCEIDNECPDGYYCEEGNTVLSTE